MRRLLSFVLLMFAPVVLAGCGSDSITDPSASVAGTYSLASFDGAAPPIVLLDGDPRIEVVSDVLTLAAAGTFTQRTTFRYTEGGVISSDEQLETGTFTMAGTTLTLRFTSDGSSQPATVSDKTIVIAVEGHTLRYVRP
ncbi:MAG TPA: hypothetical protein VFN38_09520 [Gemmatimonadaceae bacterium]|nr:hypothetical protein [Gemmatimonadaceae bacterium]